MSSRRGAALSCLAACLASPQAVAHGSATGAIGWTFEAWVVLPLLASAAWYALGAWRLGRRGAKGRPSRRRQWAFATGWTILALALTSPLHAAGSRSFAAHMLEHELLMLAAAPLLVLAAPVGVGLWALPPRWRHALGALGRTRSWQAGWSLCAGLFGATLLQAVALWAWHAPVLFGRALAHPGWHAVQHISFLASALLFWHAVWRRRARPAAVVLALFFTATISGALGAFMAFARSPWYAGYAALGLAPMGLTPLEDQQLAGLLMWVPGGVVHAGAALWLLARGLGTRGPVAVEAR